MDTFNNKSNKVEMVKTDRFYLLKFPKNESDINFIRSLKNVRWDNGNYSWLVANIADNYQKITKYFGDRLVEHYKESADRNDGLQDQVQNGEVLIIKYIKGRVRLIYRYDKGFNELVRQMPFRQWDPINRWWTVPQTERILFDIQQFCKQNQWKFRYIEDIKDLNRTPRPKPKDILNYREVPDEYLEKLKLIRYSENTIRTYCNSFKEFINYYSTKKIEDITEIEIKSYLRYLVEQRCISTSYQNQAINAIKFFYEKVQGGQRKAYFIDRPKKEKILPTVLSEVEVKAIIDSVRNLKHKCMIMLTYSAGLRVSELLNLTFSDFNADRNQLMIKGGKGKKDRITLLSEKILHLLREYYKIYRPKKYLFEGQMGGMYSVRSIQHIIKAACQKAGINKNVTMHTLRHSFATHLLEHGTDIRYIQSLLGHSNSRTTEIYTHITTKGFDQIKSPLDNLDGI